MKDIEDFELIKSGLINGKYNLFLGSGATCNCKNFKAVNNNLKRGNELAKLLCNIYGTSDKLNLAQITEIFSVEGRDYSDILVEEYNTKSVSHGIEKLPNFLWNSIYTLNVDNALEFAYKNSKKSLQNIISINFDEQYRIETSNQNVQIVHLHGFIDKKDSGFVFDNQEYIQNSKSNNAWMVTFSNFFQSSPFIISGCAFNEPDFNYYLSFKKEAIEKEKFPSLLVEPFPNEYTKSICKKMNLKLIEAEFDDFINYLCEKIPNPPTQHDLIKNKSYSFINIDKAKQVAFSHDFDFIQNNYPKTNENSPFDYGFEPSIEDISQGKAISRYILPKIKQACLSYENNFILLKGKTLNGKTALAYKVLLELSDSMPCFKLKSLSGFNLRIAIECLAAINKHCIIFIDNVAEYIDQVYQLLENCKNITILAAERNYRVFHVESVLGDNIIEINVDEIKKNESEYLIDKYLKLGLLQNDKIIKSKMSILNNKTIGEQVCLITMNFVPIENKIPEFIKLFKDERTEDLLTTVSIVCHCYKMGINYYILSSLVPGYNINNLFENRNDFPFSLCFNLNNDNYVVPQNELFMDSYLNYQMSNNLQKLRTLYINLIRKLSVYVNPETKRLRSPEYRLLGRLVDADTNVEYFFKGMEEAFMNAILDYCKWNSRYWEQRALAIQGKNIEKALQYAQQAIVIETHPFTYTTYSKILFSKMKIVGKSEKTDYCEKALSAAYNAFVEEDKRHMYPSLHPLINIINGMDVFLKTNSLSELSYTLRKKLSASLEDYSVKLNKRLNKEQSDKIDNLIMLLNK